MPNTNPADEMLAEAREALCMARDAAEVESARRAHAEALMLHALGENEA